MEILTQTDRFITKKRYNPLCDIDLRKGATRDQWQATKYEWPATFFMQNKPNLLTAQTNASSFMTRDCDNIHLLERCKNKPNTNPIDPNQKPNKANCKANQTQFQTFCWECHAEKIMFFNRVNGKYQIIIWKRCC